MEMHITLLNPKYLIQDLGKLSQWRCMDECEPNTEYKKKKKISLRLLVFTQDYKFC